MVIETQNARAPENELAALATGRSRDLFAEDLERHIDQIRARIERRRVLVLGAAGSIGASTVALISQFRPAALHAVDHSENALAELVRDLRSRREGLAVDDFQALPLDFGSMLMRRFLLGQRPYDFVLNFAALKHVRSEKDICSLLQMLDTNLLKPLRCWEWLQAMGPAPEYFSVSTDKAADPASFMGASKHLMEAVMFSELMSAAPRVISSRFANVAFSNGSLLESFTRRLEKRQPLVSPRDTYRFFISLSEAGQICVLAAILGPDRAIVIPRLDPNRDTRRLEDIASGFLRSRGLEPVIYSDEDTARAAVDRDLLRNRYPLLLTNLDTAGEKNCEVFIGDGEPSGEFGMSALLYVRHAEAGPLPLSEFLRDLDRLVGDPGEPADKDRLLGLISRVLPQFRHIQSSKMLDQRM